MNSTDLLVGTVAFTCESAPHHGQEISPLPKFRPRSLALTAVMLICGKVHDPSAVTLLTLIGHGPPC